MRPEESMNLETLRGTYIVCEKNLFMVQQPVGESMATPVEAGFAYYGSVTHSGLRCPVDLHTFQPNAIHALLGAHAIQGVLPESLKQQPLPAEATTPVHDSPHGPADVVLEAARLIAEMGFLESDPEADARVDEIIKKKNARRDFQPLE